MSFDKGLEAVFDSGSTLFSFYLGRQVGLGMKRFSEEDDQATYVKAALETTDPEIAVNKLRKNLILRNVLSTLIVLVAAPTLGYAFLERINLINSFALTFSATGMGIASRLFKRICKKYYSYCSCKSYSDWKKKKMRPLHGLKPMVSAVLAY